MKLRTRLATALATLGLAVSCQPPPAIASPWYAYDCGRRAGDNGAATFCLRAAYGYPDGRLTILSRRVCIHTSRSLADLGYQGLYGIDSHVSGIRSGIDRDEHWDRRTSTRCWTDGHDVRAGSAVRVWADFKIGWRTWPDDDLTLTVDVR